MQTISINFDDHDLFKIQVKQYYKELEYLIKKLPKKEQDLFSLYFVLEKPQKEIASVFNLTQGGVSHRINRAKQRLRYLIERPILKKETLFKELVPVVPKLEDRTMLWELYKTSCQSDAAKSIGVSQSSVRNRLVKYLKKLKKMKTNKIFAKYYDAFSLLFEDNFNILKEVKLPKWEHKNKDKELNTNKDMYLKLTASLNIGDTVLISEGAYRNLNAKILKVYEESKTADLSVQLNTLKVLAKKIPFNWFTKKNDMLLENVIHLLKTKKQMTKEELIHRMPMPKTTLNKYIDYLNSHNLVNISKSPLHTYIRYNF